MSQFHPALVIVTAMLLGVSANADEVEAKVNYVMTLGGINIATMAVNMGDTGSRYNIAVSANVTGLANLVTSGTARAHSSGRSSPQGLSAEIFTLETHANGQRFIARVGFDDRTASTFKVEPPILDNYDRVPLERRHLNGVSDFLSAFVLRGDALDKSLCQRSASIFTGVERFDVAMAYAGVDEATSSRTGYQGPVVLCTVKYTPIAGHFVNSDMTNYLAASNRIVVWYAPLGETGFYIPYRVLIGTNTGDLSMIMTSMHY